MALRARTALAAALAAASVTLTACGGSATVDNSAKDAGSEAASDTSIARAEKDTDDKADSSEKDTAKDPDKDSEKDSDKDSEKDSKKDSSSQSEDIPADGGREIDEVPKTSTDRTPEDEDFLTSLSDEGIKVDGVEDQLIGTAQTVCSEQGTQVSDATVPAVAGQLVAQERTDKDAEAVAQLLRDSSRSAYCA